MVINVHPRERVYFISMVVISLIIYSIIAGFMCTLGSAFLSTCVFYCLVFTLVSKLGSLLFVGFLKGNAIKVSRQQFPEVNALLEKHAAALQMSTVPDAYVMQANGVLNAFAARLLKRHYIVLFADILEPAYEQGIDAISFIIGHELGHIYHGHLKGFKRILTMPGRMIPFLGKAYSRACEYSCDATGFALCPQGATKGLLVLVAGKKLYKNVSVEHLLASGDHKTGWAPWLAELFATHPLVLKRIERIYVQYQQHRVEHEKPFVSPYVQVEPTVHVEPVAEQEAQQ